MMSELVASNASYQPFRPSSRTSPECVPIGTEKKQAENISSIFSQPLMKDVSNAQALMDQSWPVQHYSSNNYPASFILKKIDFSIPREIVFMRLTEAGFYILKLDMPKAVTDKRKNRGYAFVHVKNKELAENYIRGGKIEIAYLNLKCTCEILPYADKRGNRKPSPVSMDRIKKGKTVTLTLKKPDGGNLVFEVLIEDMTDFNITGQITREYECKQNYGNNNYITAPGSNMF